jgi:hypothetical protein
MARKGGRQVDGFAGSAFAVMHADSELPNVKAQTVNAAATLRASNPVVAFTV